MKGRRVWPTKEGWLKGLNQPGDYGRVTCSLADVRGHERQLWWQVIAPDGSACSLDPSIHAVIEHIDGTITVRPSIVTKTWHGWLDGGNWREVSECRSCT